jgi:hypothetical protein
MKGGQRRSASLHPGGDARSDQPVNGRRHATRGNLVCCERTAIFREDNQIEVLTPSRIAIGGSLVLRCNFLEHGTQTIWRGALWCSNLLSRRAICTIGDICDLPSSPEGAIKIDEVCRDLRVAVGKIIFALEQLGLCRDDI